MAPRSQIQPILDRLKQVFKFMGLSFLNTNEGERWKMLPSMHWAPG